jgi:hypothetical protein
MPGLITLRLVPGRAIHVGTKIRRKPKADGFALEVDAFASRVEVRGDVFFPFSLILGCSILRIITNHGHMSMTI